MTAADSLFAGEGAGAPGPEGTPLPPVAGGAGTFRSVNGEVIRVLVAAGALLAELAGLDDHLQVGLRAADLLHPNDLVVDLRVAAGEEGAAIDDHVDLVRAHRHDLARLFELHVERRLSRGERGRDRRDLHTRA